MNRPKLWNDYKLVDNGGLTKKLYTLHYFNNQLITEYDNGNVEDILTQNNQLKEKAKYWVDIYTELKKHIEKAMKSSVKDGYTYKAYKNILDKMQELENGKNE